MAIISKSTQLVDPSKVKALKLKDKKALIVLGEDGLTAFIGCVEFMRDRETPDEFIKTGRYPVCEYNGVRQTWNSKIKEIHTIEDLK